MKISTREKRILIIGGVVTVLILLFYLAPMALPGREDLSVELQAKKRTLIGQKELLLREEHYKARIDDYRLRLSKDLSRRLPGENPSIAGAELQKVLKDLADQNGVEIIRRDNQREQKLENELVKVSVRIETQCAIDQLVRFLAAVENYDRLLSVDQLTVTSFRMQKLWQIRPVLVVSGYIVVPEIKTDSKTAAAPPGGTK
jgi:type II secretory pathway component PulM